MKIIHRNTSLRTINESDIEQIRQWRNVEQVNRYLKAREFIDKQSQLDWFNSLDPHRSIYFMMEERSVPIGVVYAHNINLSERTFEGSIFTGYSSYLKTPLPVKASLMLSAFFFDHLAFEHLFSTVHFKNTAAIEMDERLGFKEIKREGDFVLSRCTKNDFENSSAILKKSLLRNVPLEILLEDEDAKYPFLKTIVAQ